MELRKTLAVWLTVMTAACSCNREAFKPVDNVVFIQDARLEEAGQTLSPGDAFHLHGIGCQQTDNVMLTFTWKTVDATIPVGKVSGIYAKKQDVTPVGITAVLPYRYPAADVEVSVMREGKLQRIGLLRITDGQSPKELRLYGVSHVSCKIDGFMLGMNNACQKSLEVALSENLHSVINVPRSYGLCGISGKDEHRTAVCVDFFTGEVKTLAIDVMALFLTPSNAAVAVVCHDGICALQTLPIEIGADYMTKSDALGPVQPTFAMPDGLKPEYFGNYPGVSIGTEESTSYLLSANKGDGNWTAVMLDKEGFHIMEDIAAESLIPFRAGSDAGYIATYGGFSLFRLVNPENGTIGQAIYTCKIGQIISATSNSEKPGHILLNVSETSNGLQIYDLAWNDTKSLSHITLPNSANDYAEVLMAN